MSSDESGRDGFEVCCLLKEIKRMINHSNNFRTSFFVITIQDQVFDHHSRNIFLHLKLLFAMLILILVQLDPSFVDNIGNQ